VYTLVILKTILFTCQQQNRLESKSLKENAASLFQQRHHCDLNYLQITIESFPLICGFDKNHCDLNSQQITIKSFPLIGGFDKNIQGKT